MVTFMILAVMMGLLLLAISGVCAILLDPLIAIFTIYGVCRLIKWCITKHKK